MSHINVIYRIHYKVLKIDYNFKALRSSLKNEIVVLETNLRKSKIITPKRLKHVEALTRMLDDWKLKETMPPKRIEN